MARAISENRISRRLRFRDLQVFFSIVQCGSMAKAASDLGILNLPSRKSLPAWSKHSAFVSSTAAPRGVEPTIYGRVLLNRGIAAFDELKQCINDIEFLADPTKGEVRIGCPDSCGWYSGPLR